MKRVRLNEEGLFGVKIKKSGIYDAYTTEEILAMEDVSEKEKRDVVNVDGFFSVAGWIENEDSTEDKKFFVQIYESHIVEVVE